MANKSSLYLYGVLAKAKKAAPKIKGIDEADVYLIHNARLSAVVSDIGQDDELLLNRENLLKHQAVIENIRESLGDILPVSYGTIVIDEKALKEKLLRAKEKQLLKALEKIKGKVEVSLKAVWLDLEKAIKDLTAKDVYLDAMDLKGRSRVVNLDQAVKIGQLVQQRLEQEKAELKKEVVEALNRAAVEHKESPIYFEEMVFNLAFLVPRPKEKELKNVLDQIKKKLQARQIVVKQSGPMAPYNFVRVSIAPNNS